MKSSQFTEVFARKLCENGVVALTFANWKTKDPDEENVLTYYLNEKELWEKEIDKFLASLKVDLQVRQQIPIVPKIIDNFASPAVRTDSRSCG